MPLYIYRCRRGHETEMRAGYDDSCLPCPRCNRLAERVPVYRDQYISGETVARNGISREAGRKANIKDKHDRTRVSVFREASEEIDYYHKKAENEAGRELPHPDLYKRALKRAKAENPEAKVGHDQYLTASPATPRG